MIWYSILITLALWIVIGWILYRLGYYTRHSSFKRRATRKIYTTGQPIDVRLTLYPPIRTESIEDRDIVFLLDRSISMGFVPGSPFREAVRAASIFINQLPDNVHAGVVTFNHEASIKCHFTNDRKKLLHTLASITVDGGTDIQEALNRCSELLQEGRPGAPKTIVLLSDGLSERQEAIQASRQLRDSYPGLQIVTVGFGQGIDTSLMIELADSEDRYFHLERTDEIDKAFYSLASLIGGESALCGLVEETLSSPDPFRLCHTSGLHPCGVEPGETTQVFWAIPVMTPGPVELAYQLEAEYPGWHHIASSGAKAIWRMPDGNTIEHVPGKSQRILVLPRWTSFLWFLLNPLFWLITRRWWRRIQTIETKHPVLPDTPPEPAESYPEPLAVPDIASHTYTLQPTLVIGLGETGAWTLCNLKERMRTLNAPSDAVKFLHIELVHPINRPPIQTGVSRLEVEEIVSIHQDLRPYIESLRHQNHDGLTSWMPIRQWLSAPYPLTTVRGLNGDRRMARLALLRQAEKVEHAIAERLQWLKHQTQGTAIVTGLDTDPEFSGQLAEITHICASQGIGVTAVICRDDRLARQTPSVQAFEFELARMTMMAGEPIVSERSTAKGPANRLFNRLYFVEALTGENRNPSLQASDFIWSLCANRKLHELLTDRNQITCRQIQIFGQAFPAAALWEWVRETTLAHAVNERWVAHKIVEGNWTIPSPDPQDIDAAYRRFWENTVSVENPSDFLKVTSHARSLTSPEAAAILLHDQLQTGSLYHAQKDYAQLEKTAIGRFIQRWAETILQEEYDREHWGIPILLAATKRLSNEFRNLIDRMQTASNHQTLIDTTGLACSLYSDCHFVLNNLAEQLESWMFAFTGRRNTESITLTLQSKALCAGIERSRQQAGRSLPQPVAGTAESIYRSRFKEWYETYGYDFSRRFRFFLHTAPENDKLTISLDLDGVSLKTPDDVLPSMRKFLDRYRNIVLEWPIPDWFSQVSIQEAFNLIGTGQHVSNVSPRVDTTIGEDDPYVVEILKWSPYPLNSVFPQSPDYLAVPFCWREEANASRLSIKIRNMLQREPQPFTPAVIHTIRDTHKLFTFFAELGLGRIEKRNIHYWIHRNGQEYPIGPSRADLTGIDAFTDVVRHAVCNELSIDDRPLPSVTLDWDVTPDEAVRQVEAHPLAQAATVDPSWKVWRDAIQGVVLEHASSIVRA